MKNYAELNHKLSKVYKRISGKGPKYLKTYELENILIIKINWYSEKIFSNFTTDDGKQIIKKTYKHIFTKFGEEASEIIGNTLDCQVTEFYYDENMALADNEKILIFILNSKIV